MLNTRSLLYRLALAIPILAGCSSQNYLPINAPLSDSELIDNEERQSDEKLIAALEKLRANPDAIDLSENMFRRQMSLTYSGTVKHLTEHHRKIIKLYIPGQAPDTITIKVLGGDKPNMHLSFLSSTEPTSLVWQSYGNC